MSKFLHDDDAADADDDKAMKIPRSFLTYFERTGMGSNFHMLS